MDLGDALRLIDEHARAGRGEAGFQLLVEVARHVEASEAWNNVQVVNCVGTAFHAFGHPRAFLHFANRAVELLPDGREEHYNLACALISCGEAERSLEAFGRSLLPWDGVTALRSAVERHTAIAGAYDQSVLHRSFSLGLIRTYASANPGRRIRAALELGCGTGLLASNLPASFVKLVGIDITPAMLAVAKARNIYTQLYEGDLVAVMMEMEAGYDTVFASCVCPYIPDLAPVFEQVARLLTSGGVFAFSTDPAPDDMGIGVSVLGEIGHSLKYLRGLAQDYGLVEQLVEVAVHRGPPGFWCCYKKP